MTDKIAVLDFGSQYNQLIVRRIRDLGVYSELLPGNTSLEKISSMEDVRGIVFSGGPNSVYDEGSPKCDPHILSCGLPLLGICYGMQMVHQMTGGKVRPGDKKEYGRTDLFLTKEHVLFKDTPKIQTVWMSHGDKAEVLAEGFEVLAFSASCSYAAAANDERKIYTLQFHPEVRNTEYGMKILSNFVFEICKAEANWSMKDFVDREVEKIRKEVNGEKVLLGLSGGVDSSVVAALLNKAIGKDLYCMFIDHGLLRKNEAKEVIETFSDIDLNLIPVDASERFLDKLKGVDDPEQKRKIIGSEFIDTFTDEIKKLLKDQDIRWLAQGTLYTDVIESGTANAQTIKSHHNVGGLPEDLKFKLIEPLNTLFKDEARELGKELGLPEKITQRQPFPGPGLAIRVIGEITEDKLRIVRDSDAILREELKRSGYEKELWQFFTCLSNIRSVGVKGDQRSYEYAVIIRAVDSIDGMTADWAKVPYEILDRISVRITNEVPGVNRVLYDITSKPPATIEYE